MGKKPSQTEDKYVLRLPDGLRARIKAAADAHGRSMNAEIVWRIENYEAAHKAWASLDAEVAKLANANEERQKEIERLYNERGTIFEAMNNQERSLQSLREAHRTLSILAKSLGQAILETGDRSDMVQVIAAGLSDVEIDTSSEASEKVEKPAWDEYSIPPDFEE